MGELENKIAQMEVDLAKLKASAAPEPYDAAAMARWQDEQHQIREARASAAARLAFSPEQLREMERAAPTSVVRDIALRDARAPQGPSGAGTSGQLSRVSSNVGIIGSNTTGWRDAVPLSNPPGTNYADRLMDAQDRRDLEDRIVAEAKRRAALKATEKPNEQTES
jgi:hypothetical protein